MRLPASMPRPNSKLPVKRATSAIAITTSISVSPRCRCLFGRGPATRPRLRPVGRRRRRALGDRDVVLRPLLLVRTVRDHRDLVVAAIEGVGLTPRVVGVLTGVE